MRAIRKSLMQVDRSGAEHAGLILRRFLHVAVKAPEKQHSYDRSRLHCAALEAVRRSRPLYELAFKLWMSRLPKEPTCETLNTEGRLIVGLGGDNVLETGLTLHHTYGVPIIPGSALKGLAAHYCDQVWGARLETDPTKLNDDNHRFRRLRHDEKRGENGVHTDTGMHHEALFGTTDDSGHIIYHDAWITPDSLDAHGQSGLVLDVMTPHHADYYSDKHYDGGSFQGQRIAPTDFDDPNPISFLSVSGRFLIVVSSDVAGPDGEAWSKLAFALLKEALREWGVGGKTSSGYGRLNAVPHVSKGSESKSDRSEANQTEPILALPKPNTSVEAEIVERREKNGGKVSWRARHIATGISGPIQNSEAVPSDTTIGQQMSLFVAYANKQEIAFKYPSEAVTQAIRNAQAKVPTRNAGKLPRR